MIARAVGVPLNADSVAPPRLVYGSLNVVSEAGQDDSYTAVYFEIAGSGSLGRITFEGLDAVRAARGEWLPYDIASPRNAGDWVFTVQESPWLTERHHYEIKHYSAPLLETFQHYVFEFHDEFVEAIAEGIWLDAADRSRPFAGLLSIRWINCPSAFHRRGSCLHQGSHGNYGARHVPTAN